MNSAYLPDDRYQALVEAVTTLVRDPGIIRNPDLAKVEIDSGVTATGGMAEFSPALIAHYKPLIDVIAAIAAAGLDDRCEALIEAAFALILDPEIVRDPHTGEIDPSLIKIEIGERADVWPMAIKADVEAEKMRMARAKLLKAQQRREAGNAAIAALHTRQPDADHALRILDVDAMA
ncbi:hypothetical protein FZC33_33090 [Labrys sp. KNU-23]|uniref:hypothetical protein n=1 Tax=Labrys sp. KNU-23 TaxID=2789216 RepID=UPI0011EFD7A1|nr:hypothetical protein [Labrys sp. KNU-23]QEN90836.1 hypothetical protein FZC33_33090 [Labrys sp. KNU-23]